MSKTIDLTEQELARLNADFIGSTPQSALNSPFGGDLRQAELNTPPTAPECQILNTPAMPLYSIGPSGIGGYAQTEYYPRYAVFSKKCNERSERRNRANILLDLAKDIPTNKLANCKIVTAKATP